MRNPPACAHAGPAMVVAARGGDSRPFPGQERALVLPGSAGAAPRRGSGSPPRPAHLQPPKGEGAGAADARDPLRALRRAHDGADGAALRAPVLSPRPAEHHLTATSSPGRAAASAAAIPAEHSAPARPQRFAAHPPPRRRVYPSAEAPHGSVRAALSCPRGVGSSSSWGGSRWALLLLLLLLVVVLVLVILVRPRRRYLGQGHGLSALTSGATATSLTAAVLLRWEAPCGPGACKCRRKSQRRTGT